MKTYVVPAGIKGVVRDLRKTMSFTPWKSPRMEVFVDRELNAVVDEDRPTYQFVRGKLEFSVPVMDVIVLNH
jgi:hypothetical protein